MSVTSAFGSGPVLYVEDDADHAELVMRSLRRHNSESDVVHLADGEAALDYLEKTVRAEVPRPQLILLDLRLPKVDGIEVLRTVKQSPALATIPVVILTTSANEGDVARAYAHHVNSYLVKPDDLIELDELMEEVGSYWLFWNVQPRAEH